MTQENAKQVGATLKANITICRLSGGLSVSGLHRHTEADRCMIEYSCVTKVSSQQTKVSIGCATKLRESEALINIR